MDKKTGQLPFTTRAAPATGAVMPEEATEKEKLAWLRLIRTENIGPVTFFQLIDAYGSAEKALEAIPELAARGGRKKPLKVAPLAEIEAEYKALRKYGGDLVLASEAAYPIALSAIADAPPVISVIGRKELMAGACLAIVGARNASHNGRKFAQNLAAELGQTGQVIVSGLARGIDTAAHKGSISTGTIAVVAGGLDHIYPPENEALHHEIAEKGLIIAESAFGQKPYAQSFPRRNRIVSGLSAGVVVVEATRKSGSLITARLAGEQGRDVFAVPGHPYDPRAAGPNYLIREGATLVSKADDIREGLLSYGMIPKMSDSGDNSWQSHRARPSVLAAQDSGDLFERARQTILSQLSFTPLHADLLVEAAELDIALIQTVLLELELAGRIRRLPGNRIVLLAEDMAENMAGEKTP